MLLSLRTSRSPKNVQIREKKYVQFEIFTTKKRTRIVGEQEVNKFHELTLAHLSTSGREKSNVLFELHDLHREAAISQSWTKDMSFHDGIHL